MSMKARGIKGGPAMLTAVTVHTVAGDYSFVRAGVVIVNKTSGAATAVNLPPNPLQGQTHIIKDGKGDAGSNNITITPAAGTIDGASTAVISTNYGARWVMYSGTEWSIIGKV